MSCEYSKFSRPVIEFYFSVDRKSKVYFLCSSTAAKQFEKLYLHSYTVVDKLRINFDNSKANIDGNHTLIIESYDLILNSNQKIPWLNL